MGRVRVWDETYYVRVYELVLEGHDLDGVSAELGVSRNTLKGWYEKKPGFKFAVKRAKEVRRERERSKGRPPERSLDGFFAYCYKRLPADLVPAWKELEGLSADDSTPTERIEAVFAHQGKRFRQHIFVHAMVVANFNATEACKMVGISLECWRKWVREDRNFDRIMQQVKEMKKDWVEGRLLDLIQKGDTQATIFANRTLNRDRGYDPRITIKHEGQILHGVLDFDHLPLDVETKRKVLAAMRAVQLGQHEPAAVPRVVQALPSHNGTGVPTVEAEEVDDGDD